MGGLGQDANDTFLGSAAEAVVLGTRWLGGRRGTTTSVHHKSHQMNQLLFEPMAVELSTCSEELLTSSILDKTCQRKRAPCPKAHEIAK